MKQVFYLLILLILSKFSFGQIDSIVKNGAYRNIITLQKNSPFLESEFEIKDISKHDPGYYNTQVYRIKSKDERIRWKTFIRETWVICDGNLFYFNCLRMDMGDDFIKIKYAGRYSYFIGRPILTEKQKRQVSNAAYAGGLIGGAIAASSINAKNAGKVHFIMDFQTGLVHYMDQKYLTWILGAEIDLLEQYNWEAKQDSITVMRKYIELLNERLKNKY